MPPPFPILDSEEEITPELKLAWYCGKQIAAYTLTSVSQATMDAFVETIARVEAHYTPDAYRLTLVEAASPSISLTPYVRRKIEEMNSGYSHVKGRTALVLSPSFMTRSLQLVLVLLWRTRQDQVLVFFDRDKGLAWLLEALPEAA